MGEEQNVKNKIQTFGTHVEEHQRSFDSHANFHLKVGDFTAFFSQVKHPPVSLPGIHN
uniref:Uncharacterized protein n=1 Tax=Anguilla anguilla TaxID=7936 RepID=A0A0E9S0H8_ANGAN